MLCRSIIVLLLLAITITTVNVLPSCLTDRGRLVAGVMLACWQMEGIRAMFTGSRDKTTEQSITDTWGSPRLQEKLDDEVLKTRLVLSNDYEGLLIREVKPLDILPSYWWLRWPRGSQLVAPSAKRESLCHVTLVAPFAKRESLWSRDCRFLVWSLGWLVHVWSGGYKAAALAWIVTLL